jgi:hypothetical protein
MSQGDAQLFAVFCDTAVGEPQARHPGPADAQATQCDYGFGSPDRAQRRTGPEVGGFTIGDGEDLEI